MALEGLFSLVLNQFEHSAGIGGPHPKVSRMRITIAALCFLTTVIGGIACPVLAQSPEDQAIRAARARSNAAIAAHDLDGISRVWMDDVHIVTSTSARGTGRDENRQRMGSQFASRPDTTYVRQTGQVDVYAPWAVASERGEWTGRWTEPDGTVTIRGTYLAQWRKIGAEWLIQAEVFVPVHCEGSEKYCGRRPR
jgi:ketosteroid isomerase-like protein